MDQGLSNLVGFSALVVREIGYFQMHIVLRMRFLYLMRSKKVSVDGLQDRFSSMQCNLKG